MAAYGSVSGDVRQGDYWIKKSNILCFLKNAKIYLLLGLRFFASANGLDSDSFSAKDAFSSVPLVSVAFSSVSLVSVSLERVALLMVSFIWVALIESFAAASSVP